MLCIETHTAHWQKYDTQIVKVNYTVQPLVPRFLGSGKISVARKSVYTLQIILTSPYTDLQISIGRGQCYLVSV